MGKSKCCCKCCIVPDPPLKYVNLTADFGFQIPNAPDPDTVLFKDVAAGVYCLSGQLKNCFDLSTGIFTVKESGLYNISVLPTFVRFDEMTKQFVVSDGERSVRVRRTYNFPRCNGTSFQEISILGSSQVVSPIYPLTQVFANMTFSATQPLAFGDQLDFLAYQTNTEETDLTLFFEFNIVKLSRENQNMFDPTGILPSSLGSVGTIQGAAL